MWQSASTISGVHGLHGWAPSFADVRVSLGLRPVRVPSATRASREDLAPRPPVRSAAVQERLLEGLACRRPRAATRRRGPDECSADLGACVVRVVPPTGDVLTGNIARAWNAGKDVRSLRGRRARARRAARRRRRRVRHARRAGHAPARSRPRARRGVGAHHAVRHGRSACVVAGLRPRRHGRDREHVLHRRPRPRAGALHGADGLRALAVPRPRSRR